MNTLLADLAPQADHTDLGRALLGAVHKCVEDHPHFHGREVPDWPHLMAFSGWLRAQATPPVRVALLLDEAHEFLNTPRFRTLKGAIRGHVNNGGGSLLLATVGRDESGPAGDSPIAANITETVNLRPPEWGHKIQLIVATDPMVRFAPAVVQRLADIPHLHVLQSACLQLARDAWGKADVFSPNLWYFLKGHRCKVSPRHLRAREEWIAEQVRAADRMLGRSDDRA